MPIPVLSEGQYDLDGYTFGALGDEAVLLESGVETGTLGVREQDVPQPLGDGVMFGRDYFSPPTWTFTIGVRHPTDVDQPIGRLSRAWRGDQNRRTPGAISELHYMRAGKTLVVYGRPGRFAVETPKAYQTDFRIVTCDFRLAEPVAYHATVQTLELTLLRTAIATGLTFPVVFPVVFGSPQGIRQGFATVNGFTQVPFRVRITGPVTGQASGFRVASTGGTGNPWAIDIPATLNANQVVEVDTATGATYVGGVARPIGLGRDTDLNARLSPGMQEIVFTAVDWSMTSTAVLSWRSGSGAPV